MMSQIVDLNLVNKLKKMGFIQLNRSMIYQDIIINNDFLRSTQTAIEYLGHASFLPYQSYNKRKKMIQIACSLMK